MKLSRLYTNRSNIFTPIDFQPGLNVVLAEIRLMENRTKDTHNLGKSTLGRLIDFCLLARRDSKFFLFKHAERFESFVFFLEIELIDGSYVTVRRSVIESTKISFKRHPIRGQDLSELPLSRWDHVDIPFERARELLDGLLDLRSLRPWKFRNGLGYLLRSQDDYRDVFQLRSGVKHSDWKPFLSHLLGFNSENVEGLYRKENELARHEENVRAVYAQVAGAATDVSKVEGLILLKEKEAGRRQALLDSFDFKTDDKEKTRTLVEQLDTDIARLNEERYAMQYGLNRIEEALKEKEVLFSPGDAEGLFAEVGVMFPGQLKKDYEQLLAFNRAISEERRQYLGEERADIEVRLKRTNAELAQLNRRRTQTLGFLKDSDFFSKYRQVSAELVALKSDLASLTRQRDDLNRLHEMGTELRTLSEEKGRLQSAIEADVARQNSGDSLLKTIRLFFDDVIEAVIQRHAVLSADVNQKGHLEFGAEIVDDAGTATSADRGHSYKKLLCVAFDLAVLRAHLLGRAPRFVFHDGVFEALDDRKKLELLEVLRDYADAGLQVIITLIDSELPAQGLGEPPLFTDEEIIVSLHDEGDDGRLFKMPGW